MPSGTLGYQYDADNRLSIVTHKDSTQTKYGYDKVGNRTSVARPNGVLTSYAYDDLNRLTNLTNYTGPTGSPTVISSYEYQLDNAGRRTKVAESGPSSQNASTSYAYDDDGRLTNETGPAGNIQYYYDNVGNRTSKVVTGGSSAGTTSYQFDTGGDDRLTGESGPGGSFGYGYDFDGNQTSETYPNGTVQTNNFDFENHLTGVTDTAGGATTTVAAYSYDADGNRLTETTPAGTTNFLVDTQLSYPSVVEERNASDNLLASYDYGEDLIRMDRWNGASATPSYYLDDGLGSTRALASSTGSVTDTYNFDAYGDETGGTTNTPNEFLYEGQQFDSGIGDYFLRARYYAENDGRFLGQDPYEGDEDEPVTLHRYLYGIDDPVDECDPSGLDVFLAVWEGAQQGTDTGEHAGIAIDTAAFVPSNPYGRYVYADFTPIGNGFITRSRALGNHLYSTPAQVRSEPFGSTTSIHSRAKNEQRRPEHLLDIPTSGVAAANAYADIQRYHGRWPNCPYGEYQFDDHNCTDFVIKILNDSGISMQGYEPQNGFLGGYYLCINTPHALYVWAKARGFKDVGTSAGSWHNTDDATGDYWFGQPMSIEDYERAYGIQDGDLSAPGLSTGF